MTALPLPPRHLLTAAEYAGLPEEADVRYELEEGLLVMSPRPIPRHQRCIRRFCRALEDQLPGRLEVLPEVDIDLRLVGPDQPGFVRSPDLVVVTRAAYERVDGAGGLLCASDVVLAVEIGSPGSRRRDTISKRAEYADAGIGHYWVVDLRDRVSLTACHLAGEFGYSEPGPVTGTFITEHPFPFRLDLDDLV